MSWTDTWTNYAPIFIVLVVAILGYFATMKAVGYNGWYQNMHKSPMTPPNWLFGVAWIILYILIAIAWGRANFLLKSGETYTLVNWFFVINIVLNLAWSLLFFGDGNMIAGLLIILLMLVSTAGLIFLLKFDSTLMVFMIIYFAWLLFAFLLNLYIVQNNCMIADECEKTCPMLM